MVPPCVKFGMQSLADMFTIIGAMAAFAVAKKETDLQHHQVSLDTNEMDVILQVCRQLNGLEALADSQGGLEAPTAHAYEFAMQNWRVHWHGARLQPSCRVEGLGRTLCQAAAKVPPVSKLAWKLTDQWTKQLHLLLLRMQDPRDCLEFARYHENSWMPPFWKWAEATPGLDSIALEELLADPEYDSYYSHAASGAPLYGSPAVETVWRPQGRFRRKRIQELQHFRILRRAAGIDLRSLTHVVEFGGGVGETVAALSDLGFSGRHLVIDLPPMLLLQRYWLRYSGLPAYLAKDLPRNNSQDERPLGRTGVLLHSALAAPHAALRLALLTAWKVLLWSTRVLVLLLAALRPQVEC